MTSRLLAIIVVLAVALSAGSMPPAWAEPEAACTITSNANWSATNCGESTVVVRNGATLTIDVSNATATSVQIGSWFSNGTLAFAANSQLTVSGNVTLGLWFGSGSIDMTNGGTLQIGGAVSDNNAGAWTHGTGTVNYNGAGAQTVNTSFMTQYTNLTLSGSGAKTISGAAVNGVLALEGTATTAGTAPTYGAAAALHYRGGAAQTTGIEFSASWIGSGGVVIDNANGVVTLGGDKAINTLNVTAGSILDLGNYTATVNGTLTNAGIIRKTVVVSGPGNYNGFSLAGLHNGGALSINVTTQGTLTNLRVDRTDANHPSATGTPGNSGTATGRWWDITPTGSGYTVDLTLPHNVSPDTAAFACEYTAGPGDGWDCARTSSTASTVTRAGVTALSPWAAGNNVGPTSITLDNLSAHSRTNWLGVLLIGAALLAGTLAWLRLRRTA